jgi:signal peptidase II
VTPSRGEGPAAISADEAAVPRADGPASRLARMSVIAAAVALADGLTKWLALSTLSPYQRTSYLGDLLRLELVENTGGFLGLGSSWPPALRFAVFILSCAVLLGVLISVAWGRHRPETAETWGLALMIGGGIANWVDRLLGDGVVDFLNVGIGNLRTGIFNVADMALLFGALLAALPLIGRRDAKPEPPPPAA